MNTFSLDELPDGLLALDESRTVTAANRAAARLLNATAEQLIGLTLTEALPLVDATGRDWWACADPFVGLKTRTRQPEVELFLPGGAAVLVTVALNRIGGPGSAVTSVVVGLRDGSARDRLDRDRADLVATVAHELRSPLTSVKGFTTTLLTRWERFTDAQRRLMLQTVEADADRVTRLITELLDVGRIDSGRLELHISMVRLPQLIQRHVDSLTARGEDRRRFELAVAPGLPETWADSDKLDQIVANLLENALRHGGGQVSITVEPVQLSGAAATKIVVTDEGPGIPADNEARIFMKFWRGGQRSGSGLGLYIVRGLVEAHGGTIALSSEVGHGASFTVLLPAGTEPG